MKSFKSSFLLLLLLVGYYLNAQEWSNRIAIVEEHLIEGSFSENKEPADETQINWIQTGGDVFALQTNNFSAGFNMMFEEFLEGGFMVKDMFVYNLGITYDVGKFNLSFMFENFLNANQQDYEMLPEHDIKSGVVHSTNYILDSPYAMALGITFQF